MILKIYTYASHILKEVRWSYPIAMEDNIPSRHQILPNKSSSYRNGLPLFEVFANKSQRLIKITNIIPLGYHAEGDRETILKTLCT